MELVIETGGHWPDAVERLLRGLPEWFGIEQANRNYVESARELPSTAAVVDGEIVGICLVRRHTPVAAEIDLLAVRRDFHRLGIGRRILDRVGADLRADGVKLLQVKTYGPSGDSIEYERTRFFYEAVGFLPLEERTDIWGPGNPCLILVKPLM
jgi:ribosomal protein S18 acetylase RimI-like enzyme